MSKSVEEKIIKSAAWRDLKEYLQRKEDESINSMARSSDIETIYQARGRYNLIQELLQMEKVILENA